MADNKNRDRSSGISARSFTVALIVIAVLMVASYVAVLLLPECSLPVWKWLLSPVLVLGGDSNTTIIAVIAFLLVIGGVFKSLEKCDLMRYMLDSIAYTYGGSKYRFLAVVTLFFMGMGALIGSFEECVPLVPIMVALAVKMGWDALTGMGMSLLAVGCGFASGVFNPFTVGVAQECAGLPMFSGAWLRAVSFVLIYGLLLLFIFLHAKKVDRGVNTEILATRFQKDEKLEKGLKLFGFILGGGIALVLCSGFLTFLQDYTMIIVAVAFLAAGISASLACGLRGKALGKAMLEGLLSMLPGVAMILMASSINYTLSESGALDVILKASLSLADRMQTWQVVLLIYLIVLLMNFFIASGSAKALMLMPLIVPLAEKFGISPQLCVLAFAFGDGFSNVFYPTNPVLLISLGLSDVSYGRWAKWTWKFQLLNLLLTSGLLMLGMLVGYR